MIFFEYYLDAGDGAAGDALEAVESLASIGYRRHLVYDNFGNFLISIEASERFAELNAYLASNRVHGRAVYYFDVCSFHETDTDLFEQVRRHELGLAAASAPRLRVAYHAACSLQHGQQVRSQPKALLQAAGFEVVEPRDSHLCCGSAGTYNLLQPEIAGELRARKVATLEERAPQVIATGNIGCMMQIGSATAVPVVHTVELLDWATGGPQPPALART